MGRADPVRHGVPVVVGRALGVGVTRDARAGDETSDVAGVEWPVWVAALRIGMLASSALQKTGANTRYGG